jgi:hypothetical protein
MILLFLTEAFAIINIIITEAIKDYFAKKRK